jgi:hypothetical protein
VVRCEPGIFLARFRHDGAAFHHPRRKPLYVRIVRADDAMKQVVDIAW